MLCRTPNCLGMCRGVHNIVFNPQSTEDYASAVYIMAKIDDKLHVLMGHNAKHDNICPFGGISDKGESSIETIMRETIEETCGVFVYSNDQMEEMLKSGSINTITHKWDDLESKILDNPLTLQSMIGESKRLTKVFVLMDLDLTKLKELDKRYEMFKDNEAMKDWIENDRLILVSLDELMEKLPESHRDKYIVQDIDGNDCLCRTPIYNTVKLLKENNELMSKII